MFWKSKNLAVFVGILGMLLSSCFLVQARDGIYLIPKGYTGYVIILFDQPDGVTPGVENGLYVYKIPADGILKVKTPGYTGIVNKSFYYVDGEDHSSRQKIDYLTVTGSNDIHGNPKDKYDGQVNQDQIENGIYVMMTGGVAITNTSDGTYSYTSFIVAHPKDAERILRELYHRIPEIGVFRHS
jgi:hypothetical protein